MVNIYCPCPHEKLTFWQSNGNHPVLN